MKKLVIILLLFPFVVFSQGKLKRAKEKLSNTSNNVEVKNSGADTNANTKQDYGTLYRDIQNPQSNYGTSYSDEPIFQSLFLDVIFYTTIGTVFGGMRKRNFNKYPYYEGYFGEYTKILSRKGKRQNIKLGVNYMPMGLNGLELNTVYKPIPIIGIDVSYVHFSEKNFSKIEYFDTFSLMANFYRIREKYVSLWWGIGFNYVGNEVEQSGFAYQVGTDIYPVEPVSLHLSFKQTLLNEQSIDVFKSQVKYHLENKVFFLGYHHYNLAGEQISSPTFGLEIYF